MKWTFALLAVALAGTAYWMIDAGRGPRTTRSAGAAGEPTAEGLLPPGADRPTGAGTTAAETHAEEERDPVEEALQAAKPDTESLEGLVQLYESLIGKPETYDARKKILDWIAQLGDRQLAETWLLRLIEREQTDSSGLALSHWAGVTLGSEWGGDGNRARSALASFRSESRPRVQHAQLVGLLTASVIGSGVTGEDVADAMIAVFRRTSDVSLAQQILSNIGELGNQGATYELVGATFARPLTDDNRRTLVAAGIDTLVAYCKKDETAKSDSVEMIVDVASRPDIGQGAFLHAVDALVKLDRKALDKLAARATIQDRLALNHLKNQRRRED